MCIKGLIFQMSIPVDLNSSDIDTLLIQGVQWIPVKHLFFRFFYILFFIYNNTWYTMCEDLVQLG